MTLTTKQLKRRAYKLYYDSDLFSITEDVAEKALDLIEHAHNPESVHARLMSNRDFMDNEEALSAIGYLFK